MCWLPRWRGHPHSPHSLQGPCEQALIYQTSMEVTSAILAVPADRRGEPCTCHPCFLLATMRV